jgi:general stress protein 26
MSLSEKQKIVAVMKDTPFAFLATCDGDQPRGRPVTPIVEDNLSIWITTSSTSRKVKQIGQNPKISLAFVQQPNADKDAVVIGKCEIVTSIGEKKRVWKLVDFDLTQYFPGGPESDEFCLLKVIVDKIEWRDSRISKAKINVYEPDQK